MPYSHEFRLLFTVHGSDRPDGMDLGGKAMLEALKLRVAEFEANPQLLRDLAGAPQTTHSHSHWALRKAGEPGMIRQSDGGWIAVRPGHIHPEDQLRTEEAARIREPVNGFWCRIENVFEPEVLADLHSDDHVIMAKVNIAPWLLAAERHEIENLQAEGWGFSEAADHVAYAMEAMGDPGAKRLFDYLGLNPRMSFTGDSVGFSLSVSESDVMEWLKARRPGIHAEMSGSDEDPSP